ncbi:hypothetical protein B0J13DRAFT_299316 [Dactylonectria estremocensis]|uniref:Uncharacterized protein n=1 Tax=Dactylonectria estremocensis TaxID=1079267 RepID=A0A9P9EZ75_9HYPO|nr:hypothetical protein B0J13DRAFT_299316 [Dactylonectria estremocensis]
MNFGNFRLPGDEALGNTWIVLRWSRAFVTFLCSAAPRKRPGEVVIESAVLGIGCWLPCVVIWWHALLALQMICLAQDDSQPAPRVLSTALHPDPPPARKGNYTCEWLLCEAVRFEVCASDVASSPEPVSVKRYREKKVFCFSATKRKCIAAQGKRKRL